MQLRTKMWYIGCGGYAQIAILSAISGSGWCVLFAAVAGWYWTMAEKRLAEDIETLKAEKTGE